MKNRIGKRYKTRNGKIVTVVGYWKSGWTPMDMASEPNESVYWPAIVLVDGEHLLYTLDGRYDYTQHELDIVAEYSPKQRRKNKTAA